MNTMSVKAAGSSAVSVADARDAARTFLEALRRPEPTTEAADTVVLVVSELVTNALRHGGGTFNLHLTAHPDTVEVAVDDASPRTPLTRTPDLNGGTGGFGWPMVNRLARAVGEILDEAPAGERLGVGDLVGEDGGGLGGQAGGEFDAFVARQSASESGEDQADGFLGPFPGGVGAFVADSLQHLLERRHGRLLEWYSQVGHHCGSCLSVSEVVAPAPGGGGTGEWVG